MLHSLSTKTCSEAIGVMSSALAKIKIALEAPLGEAAPAMSTLESRKTLGFETISLSIIAGTLFF